MQKLENTFLFQFYRLETLGRGIQVACVKPAIVVLQYDVHRFFPLLSTREGDFVGAV